MTGPESFVGTSLAVPTFRLRGLSPPREQSQQGPRGPAPNGARGAPGVPSPPGPVVPVGRALQRDLAAAEAEPWPVASGDRRLNSAPAAPLLKETEPAGSCRGGTRRTGPGTSGGPGGEGLSRQAQDPVPIPPSCPGVCGGGGIHPRHCPRSRAGSWLCVRTHLRGGGVGNVGPPPHPSMDELGISGCDELCHSQRPALDPGMGCPGSIPAPLLQGWTRLDGRGTPSPSWGTPGEPGMDGHTPASLLENKGWMDTGWVSTGSCLHPGAPPGEAGMGECGTPPTSRAHPTECRVNGQGMDGHRVDRHR